MIYNLKRYVTYRQTWEDEYQVEADSKEEAVKKIIDSEVDFVDSNMLDTDLDHLIDDYIKDENDNIIYDH